jgi:hypothetical protein
MLVLSLPARADDPPSAPPPFNWRSVNHQTAVMIRMGSYDTALSYVENALVSCPRAVDAREAALCEAIFSENRARIREVHGDIAGAETDMRTLVDRRASVLPPLDPMNEEAHFWRALFYQRQGRRAEEAADLLAAETIARAGGPAKRADVVNYATRRAQALTALGRYDEALPLYQDAYAIERDTLGPGATSTLVVASNLFDALIGRGFTDSAFALADPILSAGNVDSYDPVQRGRLTGQYALNANSAARRAQALRQGEPALAALAAVKDPDADALTTLLRGLSRAAVAIGDPAKGAEYARRARETIAKAQGENTYGVSLALRDESVAEAARGDQPAALDRLNRALAILTAPGWALARAEAEVERGKILVRMERRDDAIESHVAMIRAVSDGDSAPSMKAAVLALLGDDLRMLDSYTDAGPACETALSLAKGLTDLSAFYVVRAELCTGWARLRQNDANEALNAAARAKAALWGTLARQSGVEPSLAWQQSVLALRIEALRTLKRFDEAAVVFREKIAVDKRFDPGSEAVTWNDLAALQRQAGTYADADDSITQGLAALGADGSEARRAALLENRALIDLAQKRPADAADVYETVLALRKAGADRLKIGLAEKDLATALGQAGKPADAGMHMDVAIGIFEGLAPKPYDSLRAALNWRITNADQLHDWLRLEAALREILPYYKDESREAASYLLALAGLMDRQARRAEADALRAEAVSRTSTRFGADSAEAMYAQINGLAWLRAQGRYVEADAIARRCGGLSETIEILKLTCLSIRAENAIEAGAYRTGSEFSEQAITYIEDHWDANGKFMLDALFRAARAAAGMGDVAGLIRRYDRIHDLSSRQGTGRAWVDDSYVRMLLQAGNPASAPAVLQRVLDEARKAGDTALIVSATGQLADRANGRGAGKEAVALWAPVLPLLGEGPSAARVALLDSLARAHAAMARFDDAAKLYGEAAGISRALDGPGAPDVARLLASQAVVLARLGRVDDAEAVLRPLSDDPSPQSALTREMAERQIAQEAFDPIASVQHARIVLEQTRLAYGEDSVAAADARLDMIAAEMGADRYVDGAAMEVALGVLEAEQPGWQTALRAGRMRAMLALRQHRFKEAGDDFARVEGLIAEHQGADQIALASVRSDRAAVRLEGGDVAGADALLRQALAAPNGDWHNSTWAGIASEAAAVADRMGEADRAARLRLDSESLVPTAHAGATHRWL